MTRVWKTAILAVALAATAGSVSAQTVLKYTKPKLYIYDAAGNPIGEKLAKDLPANPQVEGEGKGRTVGIRVDGKLIYLDPSNVVVDKAGKGPCTGAAVVQGREASSGYAASGGRLNSGGGGCSLEN